MSDIGEPFSKLFRDKFAVKLPEKADREAIIKWILQQGNMEYDVQQIAKYLQGKAFKEIKSILTKVTKGKPSEDLLTKRLA